MEKIYTIKDEKADCNKCDYCDDDSAYYCIKRCREEKHWKGYVRTCHEELEGKLNDGN